jgi:hypothetical protein
MKKTEIRRWKRMSDHLQIMIWVIGDRVKKETQEAMTLGAIS